MANGSDLRDAEFGEPEDEAVGEPEDEALGGPEDTDLGMTEGGVAALAGDGEPAVVELVADTEVVVIAEENILEWRSRRAGLQLKPVQLALYAGWTMAVLYGTIPSTPVNRPSTLPTVNELTPRQRRKLELARLHHLLSSLLPDHAGLDAVGEIPVGDEGSDTQTRRSKLQSLNLAILTALTARQPQLQLAYELGRSLRDTANPPGGAEGLDAEFEHGRVAKLQDWLVTLAPEFPRLTAAVVAGSLGKWSDLAAVTLDTQGVDRARGRLLRLPLVPGIDKQASIAESMRAYLLRQGDVWLTLLIGELVTTGLLTPEGYVSAGEAALRRTGAIVRGILRHYWFGLLCVAAALAGTLLLAALYLEGAGRVWTSIACIAGGLGVSVQTIASTSSRLAAEAERPVFAMAEEDAMTWAITTMPPLTDLTARGVRHLRRAGVAPTASLGRF